MVTCSAQVYCASGCLFCAIACLTSARRCCNSGFCALTGRLNATATRRTNATNSILPNVRVFLIWVLSPLTLGREILQQLLHGVVQILLLLVLVRAGVECLARAASPNELFSSGLVP